MPSPGTLVGYALLYNVLSSDRGGYSARFSPGKVSLVPGGDVRALYGHDEKALLGRVSSGTLKLNDDGYGLKFELSLPDTTVGRDIAELIRRGDITGCSFGIWETGKSKWNVVGGTEVRDYGQCVLDEVTITGNPSFPQSSVRLIERSPRKATATPNRARASIELAELDLAILN